MPNPHFQSLTTLLLFIARYAAPGQSVDVVIEVESGGICVEEFSRNKDFGRVSLLSNGRLIAVGVVLAKLH